MSDQDDLTKELESIFDEEGHRLSATMHLEKLLGIPAGRLELSLTEKAEPEIDEAGEPVMDPWKRIHSGVHDVMDEIETSLDITQYVMANEKRKMRQRIPDDHPLAAILDFMAEQENEEPTDG